jgi:hypothetical protein
VIFRAVGLAAYFGTAYIKNPMAFKSKEKLEIAERNY